MQSPKHPCYYFVPLYHFLARHCFVCPGQALVQMTEGLYRQFQALHIPLSSRTGDNGNRLSFPILLSSKDAEGKAQPHSPPQPKVLLVLARSILCLPTSVFSLEHKDTLLTKSEISVTFSLKFSAPDTKPAFLDMYFPYCASWSCKRY